MQWARCCMIYNEMLCVRKRLWAIKFTHTYIAKICKRTCYQTSVEFAFREFADRCALAGRPCINMQWARCCMIYNEMLCVRKRLWAIKFTHTYIAKICKRTCYQTSVEFAFREFADLAGRPCTNMQWTRCYLINNEMLFDWKRLRAKKFTRT